jgi:methionyl aminopeptidase
VIKDGYHGDTSMMFLIGEPSILPSAWCQRHPGMPLSRHRAWCAPARLGDIGHVIQKHAENNHYSVVREYCGHGIGSQFHEEPQVLHYGRPGTGMELQPGMTFTIEPMINAGKRHVTSCCPTSWTVVTKDRKCQAQWEHTLLLTEDGCEVPT